MYDIEHQVSLGSVEEWVSDNYGIIIPTGYITYITPDRSRLMGNVLESTAVGTRVVSWYVAPPLENNRRPCIHTTATHFPNERNRRKQHEKNSIGGPLHCSSPQLASLPNRKNAPSTYRRPNSRSPRSGQHPKPLQ